MKSYTLTATVCIYIEADSLDEAKYCAEEDLECMRDCTHSDVTWSNAKVVEDNDESGT